MQKKFLKVLSLVMVIAFILTTLIMFIQQTLNAQSDAIKESSMRIDEVINTIQENNAKIDELTQSMNEDSISKTKAFATMIALDPDILANKQKLDSIRDSLRVDELCVTDENGIIQWGTVAEQIGFDFNTNDQTKPFLEGLTNPTFELAQEAQPSATSSTLFQYVGVSRQDNPGIVQVGLKPEKLDEALKNNKLSNVLLPFTIGKAGYIFVLANADGTVLSHPNQKLIGSKHTDIGIKKDIVGKEGQKGFAVIDGKKIYYYTQLYNNMTIIAVKPESELFAQRNKQTIIFSIAILFVFITILIAINIFVKKQIINPVVTIDKQMQEISDGNFSSDFNLSADKTEIGNLVTSITQLKNFLKDIIQDVSRCYSEIAQGNFDVETNTEYKGEFLALETALNQTIMSLSDTIAQIDSSSNLVSSGALQVSTGSQTMAQGATEQAGSIEELSATVQEISDHVTNSAKNAEKANQKMNMVDTEVKHSHELMQNMISAMQNIEIKSEEISKIIKTIDNIAFQTNILALNAAVEAARAGAAGKGFAVVADEVRNLASQSANAAKSTTSLIEESISAVTNGSKIADETANALNKVVDGVHIITTYIEDISQATNEQSTSISQVHEGANQISVVVQSNSATAEEGAAASEELSVQAAILKDLVSKFRIKSNINE